MRVLTAHIEIIQAFEIIFLDFRDVIVLEIDEQRVCRNVLWHLGQTCTDRTKENEDL